MQEGEVQKLSAVLHQTAAREKSLQDAQRKLAAQQTELSQQVTALTEQLDASRARQQKLLSDLRDKERELGDAHGVVQMRLAAQYEGKLQERDREAMQLVSECPVLLLLLLSCRPHLPCIHLFACLPHTDPVLLLSIRILLMVLYVAGCGPAISNPRSNCLDRRSPTALSASRPLPSGHRMSRLQLLQRRPRLRQGGTGSRNWRYDHSHVLQIDAGIH